MKYFRDNPESLYYLLGVLILVVPIVVQVLMMKGKYSKEYETNAETLAARKVDEAAQLYMDAGEFGKAQTYRMLIVGYVSLPHGQSCACSECLMKYDTTFKPASR